jgi:hypothetical protein
MTDSEEAVHGVQLDCLLKIPQLALCAADLGLAVSTIDCQTGRVVSPILQPLQAL